MATSPASLFPAPAQTQPEMPMEETLDRLELDSRLGDLARASLWIEAVAKRLGLEERLRFSLQLCLEEALANIVLHGYKSEPGHPIRVESSISGDSLVLTIEDWAPPFVPPEGLDCSATGAVPDLDSIEPGGNGIRLLCHFAGSVAYEHTSLGNRLTIGFPLAQTK
jgi:serine/threonine-protein kinase RsbW